MSAVISDGLSVSQAAEKVGVSRQTLHSWLARYEAQGFDGLVDRAHRPVRCPQCLWPRWSAPSRAERPSSSMTVATVLRKLWGLASGAPSSSRTERHSFRKLFGSRRVPSRTADNAASLLTTLGAKVANNVPEIERRGRANRFKFAGGPSWATASRPRAVIEGWKGTAARWGRGSRRECPALPQ